MAEMVEKTESGKRRDWAHPYFTELEKVPRGKTM